VTGAHYEAEIEREGVAVRVAIDVTRDAYHDDADETAEALGSDAARILGRYLRNRTAARNARDAPF